MGFITTGPCRLRHQLTTIAKDDPQIIYCRHRLAGEAAELPDHVRTGGAEHLGGPPTTRGFWTIMKA